MCFGKFLRTIEFGSNGVEQQITDTKCQENKENPINKGIHGLSFLRVIG